MVKTIKSITQNPDKDIRPPVLSFKQSHAYAQQNINILTSFKINIGEALDTQQGSPLEHG